MVRRSRNEIEQLVVDAAVDLVRSEGMGIGLEGVTYTRVFRHLEATTGQRVTRASVHERVWSDQAAFQAAVRDRIAAVDDHVIDLTALDAATDQARVAMLEEAEVRHVLGTVMRSLATVEASETPPALRQANAAVKALIALADEDERERATESVEAFRSSQQRRTEVLTGSYGRTIRRLGGTIRPELGIGFDEAVAVVVRAVDGLCEGLQLRAPFDDAQLDHVTLALGDPERASWPITSIVGFSLIETFFDFPERSAG